MNNDALAKSLPILAAVLGRKRGVKVVVGGNSGARVDLPNKTIYIPALPTDYVLSAKTSITVLCATTSLTLSGFIVVCNQIPRPGFYPGRVSTSAL